MDPHQVFQQRLLTLLLNLGYERAYPHIPVRFGILRKSLRVIIDGHGIGRLQIPHYFAEYVHDGRGRIRAKEGRFLVWFKDPAKDPRLNETDGMGLYPIRRSQIAHLSARRFYFHLKKGELIIRKEVGPTKPQPFFANDGGMAGFAAEADSAAQALFSEHVKEYLGDLLNINDSVTL